MDIYKCHCTFHVELINSVFISASLVAVYDVLLLYKDTTLYETILWHGHDSRWCGYNARLREHMMLEWSMPLEIKMKYSPHFLYSATLYNVSIATKP